MTPDPTIQEMSRRSGFSEATLRYYEKIGLVGRVPRDDAGYRRYDEATVELIEALGCLRSAGVGVAGMRRYLDLTARDDAAAELRELFATEAAALAAEIDRLRVRHEYLAAKERLFDARVRGDAAVEKETIEQLTEVLDRF